MSSGTGKRLEKCTEDAEGHEKPHMRLCKMILEPPFWRGNDSITLLSCLPQTPIEDWSQSGKHTAKEFFENQVERRRKRLKAALSIILPGLEVTYLPPFGVGVR